MTKPSQEQAANLLDQLQLDDDLFKEEPLEPISEAPKPEAQVLTLAGDETATPEIKQDTNTQVSDAVEGAKGVHPPVKINGFSMLLDHLKAEAIKHEQRRQKRHQDTQRFAA